MKWLLITLLAFAIYQFGFNTEQGEFDTTGNPKVVLFVIDSCPPCDSAINLLTRLRIGFELLKPMNSSSDKARLKPYESGFSGQQFPLLVVGDIKVEGFAKHKVIEAYGKAFGLSALGKKQQGAYKAHFDGLSPKVVMYGTSWCGYCKKARAEFANHNIDFIEWDVERDTRAAGRFKQLGGNGYPLIYVGFERLHEVNDSVINAALKSLAEPI